MAKDAVATMGAVLPADAGGRDAVHVAVFSATSPNDLSPGEDVVILAHGEIDAVVTSGKKGAVGMVDPFIREGVKAGQRFWVYLYPRTITALSHRWSHPAFEAAESSYVPPSQKLVSEKWLRDYCLHSDIPSYKVFMRAVADCDSKEYLHISGQDASGDIPVEVWEHVEAVLGRKITARPKYFSCSC